MPIEKRKIEQLELIRSLIAFNDHQNVPKELCHSSHRTKERRKKELCLFNHIIGAMKSTKATQKKGRNHVKISLGKSWMSLCIAFLHFIRPHCWFLSLQLWWFAWKISWNREYFVSSLIVYFFFSPFSFYFCVCSQKAILSACYFVIRVRFLLFSPL